jgi:hypothetical protein
VEERKISKNQYPIALPRRSLPSLEICVCNRVIYFILIILELLVKSKTNKTLILIKGKNIIKYVKNAMFKGKL